MLGYKKEKNPRHSSGKNVKKSTKILNLCVPYQRATLSQYVFFLNSLDLLLSTDTNIWI